MGDLGVQVSVRSSVRLSIRQHLPWVSCERNSSYSFVPIFLKLCMCFHHGMRMCMWFGYYCEVIFCHFFHFANLVIFLPQWIDSGYLVSATPHTILYQSFWNFAHAFSMVWRYAYGLDIILALIFVTFCRTCFSMGELGVQVSVRLFGRLSVRPSTFTMGVFWAQLLLQFFTDLFETLQVFSSWCEDVHMVWI